MYVSSLGFAGFEFPVGEGGEAVYSEADDDAEQGAAQHVARPAQGLNHTRENFLERIVVGGAGDVRGIVYGHCRQRRSAVAEAAGEFLSKMGGIAQTAAVAAGEHLAPRLN